MDKLKAKSAQSGSVFFEKLRGIFSMRPLFKKDYTYISSGITLTGDMDANENVVLDGNMSGNIRSTKHFSMGAQAHFKGNVESEYAVISGTFEGRIHARRSLIVRVPATIVGDLISASVQVESGVKLRGKILSGPQGASEADAIQHFREQAVATLMEPVEDK